MPTEEINLVEEGQALRLPVLLRTSVASTVAELKDAPRTLRARDVVAPRLALPAHTTPLGITFYRGTRFPEPYRSSLYVAMHGSTTRSTKVGYAVDAW